MTNAKIDERGLEGSPTVGYYGRIFHNRDNPQQVVSVYVFCGHPRNMTQHTPDQCYPLNGNDAADDQQKHVVDAAKCSAHFLHQLFSLFDGV